MKDDVFFEETQSYATNYETERNKPMPSYNHGSIQANLIFLLKLNYGKKYRPISELSLSLNDWFSVPDICLFKWKKLDTKNDTVKTVEPPLCAVEILSPTQSLTELLIKARNYFEFGVKSCWIVLPGLDNIYVFSAADDYSMFKKGEVLQDEVMGIELEVNLIFE